MVDEGEAYVLRVDAAVGTVSLFPLIGGVDTAGDRAILESLLHRILASNAVVGADIVPGRGHSSAVLGTGLVGHWWWGAAVHAVVDGVGRVLEVIGDVLLARGVDEAVVVGSFVNLVGVSAVARAAPLVVDNHLGIKSNRGDGGQVREDVEPVSDSGGRSHAPARATVAGDVLVDVP